jgi:catechol 2,3-dioxygenase
MAFLASNGRDHHEIGLVEVGTDAPGPQKGEIGLVHIAFRLRDEDHLRAAYRDLKEHQVPILSTVDPDGHQLEVYCDNSPEYIANLPNSYAGMDKLDFATEEPGIREALRKMMN